MDEDKRRQLEERRLFMQRRNEAQHRRAEMEPAIGALEAAGEAFRVYDVGEEPAWSPAWVPAGYSYVPWRELPDAQWSADGLIRAELAAVLRVQLARHLAGEDRVLFIAEGKRWSIELSRAAFDIHAEALLEAAWDRAWLAAPPAPWLIFADGHQAVWKDG